MSISLQEILSKCDSTLLKPNATEEDILALCAEAKNVNCAAVCVNGAFASTVNKSLAGTNIKTCVVVGFPLGGMATAAKAEEARFAVEDGADEIDMVIAISQLLCGNFQAVQDDIAAVVKAANGKTVKAIIETCFLDDELKLKACELALNAGANFVKTSTGFGPNGATVSDVALMRHCVGSKIGVKASGGIRTAKDASAMIEAGASRIGTGSLKGIIDSADDLR